MRSFLGPRCTVLILGTALHLARALPASTRTKRDENESVRPSYGRGVAFYLGEPCNTTCNAILYNIYCNKTTNRCECMAQYPVVVNEKHCVEAIKLSGPCEHTISCVFYEPHSICPDNDKHCRCQNGYRMKVEASGDKTCTPVQTTGFIDNSDLTTMVSVIGGLMIFTALFCLVLRLFSRARFNRPRDRLATASGAPSVVFEGMDGKPASTGSSRRPSRSSTASNDLYPGSRRPSLSILAPPPSRPGSRRPSSGSQGSLRSASFRSHASPTCTVATLPAGRTLSLNRRDPVRRTASSPTPGVSGFRAHLHECRAANVTETTRDAPTDMPMILMTNHMK